MEKKSRASEWLSRNAVRAALYATGFAFGLPALILGVVALACGWSVSSDPNDWAKWLPAFAAVWGALVTAGYFVITAAVLHMTAEQTRLAAIQTTGAAAAAERSATESRLSAEALRGTIEQQRLERVRSWAPVRTAVEKLYGQVAALLDDAAKDSTGFPNTTVRRYVWWSEELGNAWSLCIGLIPELRIVAETVERGLRAVEARFQELEQQEFRAAEVMRLQPSICETAEALLKQLHAMRECIAEKATRG
jgi:hypothetical protein